MMHLPGLGLRSDAWPDWRIAKLLADDTDLSRGVDADSHPVALYLHHHEGDTFANPHLFTGLPAEN
jgi:hypothetical protein